MKHRFKTSDLQHADLVGSICSLIIEPKNIIYKGEGIGEFKEIIYGIVSYLEADGDETIIHYKDMPTVDDMRKPDGSIMRWA